MWSVEKREGKLAFKCQFYPPLLEYSYIVQFSLCCVAVC